MKICSKCKQSKDESEFYIKKRKTLQFFSICKKCHLEYSKSWDFNNRKRKREIRLKSYYKNKYKIDRIKTRGYWKKWYRKDIQKNRIIKLIDAHKRRAKMNKNGGTFSTKEWETLKKKYDYMCLCCKKKEPEIKLTIDHIVPIIMSGKNSIDNIQPLCLSCNVSKYTKIISYIK